MRGCSLALLFLLLSLPARAEEKSGQRPVLVLNSGGHTAPIVNLMFTPDGKRLISAAEDSTVRIWDTSTGESLQVLRMPVSVLDRAGPGLGSHAAALSADGRVLAVAGWSPRRQQAILLYDLVENKVRNILVGHTSQIVSVSWSKDGKWLASGGGARQLFVWDVATGANKYKLTGHQGRVQAVAFLPDGAVLASGDFTGALRLWSMQTGKLIGEEHHVPGGITNLAWSPDGKSIATSGRQQRPVHLFNADGSPRGTIERTGIGEGLAFSLDGRTLLAGSSLIDVAKQKERGRFLTTFGPPFAAALSPDNKLAANGRVGSGLFLWRTEDRKLVHQLGGRDRAVTEVFWSRDGQTIGWKQVRQANEREHPELAFRLPELKFVRLAANDRQGAEKTRGGLSLKKHEKFSHRIEVKRGEKTVQEIQAPGGIGTISCFTFLGDKHAAIGQASGLFLYEVETGKQALTYKGSGALRSVAPAPGKDYFVAGGNDEVLRVYTTEREVPLVSLYVVGENWIAWTPEGYYAASPGGERLMGWQVPGQGNELPVFYAANQFHKSLYRPDGIRRLFQTRNVVKAVALADKEKSNHSGAALEIEKVLPPQVRIVSPEKQHVAVSEPKLKVKAVGQSNGIHPITSLQLLLDERPYDAQHGLRTAPVPKMGKVEREWEVELTPGSHRIAILAKSDVSSTTSTAIEVTYTPAKAPPANDLRSSLYVLAIGINAYAKDMKLDYAVKDAADLVQAIQTHSKPLFREVQTQLLTDKEATRQGILDKLGWLKKQMKPHDVAAIFYAGHGYRDDKGRFYLLSIDMNPDNLDKTTVTGEELKKNLAEMPGRVLLMMDACHAGAIGDRVKGTSITDDLARELSDDDCGVIVMCAAMGGEESRESTKEQHGLFTLALIEGLGGKADYNKDGLIQLTELDLYVDNRVSELSNDDQHPVTAKPTTVRSFALAKY